MFEPAAGVSSAPISVAFVQMACHRSELREGWDMVVDLEEVRDCWEMKITYTMNPVPTNERIVPTPNSARRMSIVSRMQV